MHIFACPNLKLTSIWSVLLFGWLVSGPVRAIPEAQDPAFVRVDSARALDLARRNNPEWQALLSGPKAAAGDVTQAGMFPNPTLTLGSSIQSRLSLESIGLTASQEIELGGKRQRRLALAQTRLEQAETRVLEGERQLRLQLREQLAELLYAQNLAEIRQELLNLTAESLRLTRQRLKLGDVAGLDVLQLETELARRQAAVQELGGQLGGRRAAVARALGEPAGTNIWLEGSLGAPRVLPSLDRLQAAALTRPDLVVAQQETEAQVRDVALQQARGVSDLTGSVGLTRETLLIDSSGPLSGVRDTDYVLGLSVSIPLPINDTNEGNIEKARAQAEGAELRAQAQRQRVLAEVAQAYQEWTAAQTVAATLEDSAVERARRSLDLTNRAYALGQRSLLNVLQARQEYFDLRVQRLDALRAQELALVRLEAAVGEEIP